MHIHRNLCHRLQMAKADDIGCGRDRKRQLKQETKLPIAVKFVNVKKTDDISRRVGIQAWYDHINK